MRQMNLVYSMRRKRKVKKRRIIIVLGLSITLYISLYLTACGKQESLNSIEPTEQQEQTETIEETIETEADTTDPTKSDPTEETEQESLSSEATNSEGLTVEEAETADVEYMDKLVESGNYEGDIFTQYDAYVKDQGADAYDGAWLIYYYGSAAGDQRSYAINQRTGEKIVAGPDSYFYGTSLDDDGASPFYGTDKTYPGDKYPEFEQNMRLAIGEDPAYLYE